MVLVAECSAVIGARMSVCARSSGVKIECSNFPSKPEDIVKGSLAYHCRVDVPFAEGKATDQHRSTS